MTQVKTKKTTPRGNMVMYAHHHRWATRRMVDAGRSLDKTKAVHVALHNGQRVKPSPSTVISTNSVPGRGSFDAFVAAELAPKALMTTVAGSSQIDFSPYSPHLLHASHRKNLHDPSLFTEFSSNSIEMCPVHAYFADLGLPCGSIHNTFAHLYAAENLWFKRYNNIIPTPRLHDLWETYPSSQTSQWSDHFSREFGLPIINIDTIPNENIRKTDIAYVLTLSLDEQHALAQNMLSSVGLHLVDQCTEWLATIQGTNELDLFDEIRYFSTAFPLQVFEQDIAASSAAIPQSLTTLSHNTSVRYFSDDHFEQFTNDVQRIPRAVALNHLFMHAAHHRGQVLSVASQFTGEQTVVDLTAFYPEWQHIHSKAFRWA